MSVVITEGCTKKEIRISKVFLLVADCPDKHEQKKKGNEQMRATLNFPLLWFVRINQSDSFVLLLLSSENC